MYSQACVTHAVQLGGGGGGGGGGGEETSNASWDRSHGQKGGGGQRSRTPSTRIRGQPPPPV